MGEQRNNTQWKGKEKPQAKELNEILEASKLSDIELKIMVIRTFKELNENYISMKKVIETMNKNQLEMKNAISEIKNTLEGIKMRLNEAEDQQNRKNTQSGQQNEKGLKKKENSLRELWDNMKGNNTSITGIPEGEETKFKDRES